MQVLYVHAMNLEKDLADWVFWDFYHVGTLVWTFDRSFVERLHTHLSNL